MLRGDWNEGREVWGVVRLLGKGREGKNGAERAVRDAGSTCTSRGLCCTWLVWEVGLGG